MMISKRRLLAGVFGLGLLMLLVLLALGLGADPGRPDLWLRTLSLPVAFALLSLLVLGAAWGIRKRRARLPRSGGVLTGPAAAPLSATAVARAAEIQAKRASEFADRVGDPARREELKRELRGIDQGLQAEPSSLHVVVLGTVSAGKTSLINALLGRQVGATEAVMGTTRRGETHTYELKTKAAAVYLTDTPGLGEAGQGGESRENEARALAVRADLLLFVVDHDLTRAQYETLLELGRLGKRSILVLNKKDLFPPDDLAQILAKLRQRLAGVIDPADIVAVAASPRPVPVRVTRPDGSRQTVLQHDPPDLADLKSRVAEVLRREGQLLHAANLLIRGRLIEQEACQQVMAERDRKAQSVIEQYQWKTAGTVFANPIPALDVLAGGSVLVELIAELARTHEVSLNPSQVRNLAGLMAQSVLKLGLLEAATSLIAGIFKRSLVGFAAGGAVQAVTMAYLTRVVGKAFQEYFRNGQVWSGGGIDATLLKHFQETSRLEFLQDFAGQAVQQFLEKVRTAREPTPAAERGNP